jgi:hypothetical protein
MAAAVAVARRKTRGDADASPYVLVSSYMARTRARTIRRGGDGVARGRLRLQLLVDRNSSVAVLAWPVHRRTTNQPKRVQLAAPPIAIDPSSRPSRSLWRIHIGRERGTRTRGGHLVLRSFPRLVFIYFWLLRAWAVLVLGSGTSRSKSNLFFPFTHHMPFTFTVSIDHRRRLLACSVFWLLLRLLLLQC